jgi:hypothetical protein
LAYHQPFQVIGYHSCDRDLGLRLLRGDDQLKQSTNPWDWLGPGIYFWEQNPHKAMEYADHEGVKIYEDSNFTDGLHIEVSVINADLIKGYFLPRPIAEYNPYLKVDFNRDEYLKLHPDENAKGPKAK